MRVSFQVRGAALTPASSAPPRHPTPPHKIFSTQNKSIISHPEEISLTKTPTSFSFPLGLITLHCFPSFPKHRRHMTTSFGTAKAAIAMDPNLQITASFNGLRSASNSLLLARRPQVFLPSSGGTASFIRAVSTVSFLFLFSFSGFQFQFFQPFPFQFQLLFCFGSWKWMLYGFLKIS